MGGIPANPARAALPDVPRSTAPGKSFAVPARSRAKYYLSRDTKRSVDDVRLIGPANAKVSVPSVAPGAYRLLSCAGSTCSASRSVTTVAAGSQDQILAFSNSHDVNDPYIASNANLDPGSCPASAPPGRLPSTAGALSAANKLLADAGGPQGTAAFKRSAAYKTADAAESAAVEAIGIGKPGAALAALLRAHELQPNEPRYIVGAAAILTGLGHPKEALALVNAASDLAPTKSAPFGINVQAVALNAKGEALIALGQFADAETFLRAAIAIEPLLSEAKQNLAVALFCRRQTDEAMRFLRVGSIRQAGFNPDGSFALPPIEDTLDLTQRKKVTLPFIPLPESFDIAKKSEAFYGAISQASADRLRASRTRDQELMKQDFAHPDGLFTKQRQLEIFEYVLDPPQFRAQKQAVEKMASSVAEAEIGMNRDLLIQSSTWNREASAACSGLQGQAAYQACFQREYNARCSGPTSDANNKLAELLAAEEKAERDYIEAYYPFATAVLANIANPVVHERFSLIVEQSIEATWAAPLQALGFWAHDARLMFCGNPPPSVPDPPLDGPATERSEPCPPFVKGIKLSWKFGDGKSAGVPYDLAVDVNCDKVSLEASGQVEGWLGAFGQLDWSPRSGKMTIFAGPKVGAKIPGTSIGGSFKDGLYITFKGDDSIGDFGFRTSVSGSAGFGPFSIKGGDSMDFSFAPVFGLAK